MKCICMLHSSYLGIFFQPLTILAALPVPADHVTLFGYAFPRAFVVAHKALLAM